MALTRSTLKAMGLEEDKIDSLISMHAETVDALKQQRDQAQAEADRVPDLEKKIRDLEASKPTEDWESKYASLKEEYDGYREQVDRERSDKEKSDLYRALLIEQGVDPKRIDSIMRITDLGSVTVKDGQLDGRDGLAERIAEEWGDFVVKEITRGASVDDPPNGGGKAMTKDEIMGIKDTAQRQAKIAENPELFGLA